MDEGEDGWIVRCRRICAIACRPAGGRGLLALLACLPACLPTPSDRSKYGRCRDGEAWLGRTRIADPVGWMEGVDVASWEHAMRLRSRYQRRRGVVRRVATGLRSGTMLPAQGSPC